RDPAWSDPGVSAVVSGAPRGVEAGGPGGQAVDSVAGELKVPREHEKETGMMTGIVRSTVQVFTDGPPAAKLGATGFAIIWAAISETAVGILFAGVASMWGLDMLIGV